MASYAIIMKMAELFLVMLVGFAARKLNLMDETFCKKLSALVINLAMPFYMLASVSSGDDLPSGGELLKILLFAFACYVVLLAGALLFTFLIRAKPSEKGVYRFMLTFGNVGFIGYPVAEALLGSRGIFYTTIFNIPFNLLIFTLGILFLTGGKGGKLRLKQVLSPCLVAAFAVLVLAFTKFTLPAVINNTFSLVGQLTTPAALLIIGATLAGMPAKKMLGSPRLWVVTALKLLAMPLVTYGFTRLTGSYLGDPAILLVPVILAGMPVATNGTMLSFEFGADHELMTQGTFLSTVCAVATMPLVVALLS